MKTSEELAAWMSKYQAAAEVALDEHPQLLESLGWLVRNEPPAASPPPVPEPPTPSKNRFVRGDPSHEGGPLTRGEGLPLARLVGR